jgi:hypothetical protein
MTTIITRNNQTQGSATISSVNTTTVEVGELLVDVHNGSIGFLDDTGATYHQIHAGPSTALDGVFPYYYNNRLSGLNPGVMFLDGSVVRFGAATGAKRVEVNGWAEIYSDAGDELIKGYSTDGSGGWEQVFEVNYNEVRLTEGNDGPGCIEFIDLSSNSLKLKQGTGQSNDLTFRFPADYGTNGQVLQTNGSGTLSWTNNSGSGGSGTVNNSGIAGTFAHYSSTGTTVDPVSSSVMSLSGSNLSFSQGINLVKGTRNTQLINDLTSGTDPALQVNLSSNTAEQLYIDISDTTSGTTYEPCVRIEPTKTIVGTSSKPALRIGSSYLSLYTEDKKGVIRNDDTGGYIKIQASNSANSAIDNIMTIGAGSVDVTGNISASGTVTGGSSRSYKENIEKVSEEIAYNAVMALEPVTYVYKGAEEQEHLGFIAEDVPELVAMNDRKSLAALDITAALTKVIQKQDKEIDVLKKDIKELRNLILNSGVN